MKMLTQEEWIAQARKIWASRIGVIWVDGRLKIVSLKKKRKPRRQPKYS